MHLMIGLVHLINIMNALAKIPIILVQIQQAQILLVRYQFLSIQKFLMVHYMDLYAQLRRFLGQRFFKFLDCAFFHRTQFIPFRIGQCVIF